MATDTLHDNAILAGLFDQAFSPITTYGKGILAQATERRAREDRLKDLSAIRTQEEEFQLRRDANQAAAQLARDKVVDANQLARDKMQEAHREKMVGIESAARVKERLDEAKQLSAAKQEEMRKSAIDQARSEGIVLPDDAPYSLALGELAKSHGRRLIAAADSTAKALGQYSEYLGKTQQEVLGNSMAQAIASLTPKEIKSAGLTLADQNQLITNPGLLPDLRAKALREGNKDAYALLNRINSTVVDSVAEGMKAAETNKPALAGLANTFKLAQSNFQDLVKKGGADEASSIEASKRLVQASRQVPPQAAVATRPPPGSIVGGPVGVPNGGAVVGGVPIAEPTSQPFRGVVPMAMDAAGSAAGAVGSFYAPAARAAGTAAKDIWSGAFGGGFRNPLDDLFPPTPAQAAGPNPELQRFLDERAKFQNSQTPIAFPGNQMPAALPYGYQP